MNAEPSERTKQIIEEARCLAPCRRPSYVDLACGGVSVLRAEVRSLVTSYEEVGSLHD